MTDLAVQLRLTSILGYGKPGGAVFAGVTEAGERYVVVCDYKQVPDPPFLRKGQYWSVRGPVETSIKTINGIRAKRAQIKAEAAEMLRPAGKNIVKWLIDCRAPGVGEVKAKKLWDRYGPALIEHLASRNLAALTKIISAEAADVLCHALASDNIAKTLFWLDKIEMRAPLGAKILAYYKDQAQAKIEANPYCLISFEAKWDKVDTLARERFGIGENDPRRLEAAVEQVLYQGMSDGHTCLPTQGVKSRLATLLGSGKLAKQALALGESTQYVKLDDYYQPAGTYLIENYIAQRLREIAAGEAADGQQVLFGQAEVDGETLAKALDAYEAAQGFELTDEQSQAVITSASTSISLILGGAGTGKTTVLRALYAALEVAQPGIAIYQVALAGRAAQRMTEATARPSYTIAGFLANVDPRDLQAGSLVVIDETSMVDSILFYRLLRHVPKGLRLILVGDPSQLPPIGPGLVLHALAGNPVIPQTELKVVKRQSSESGIPVVAAAIRHNSAPIYAPYRGLGSGVSFVPSKEGALESAVLRLYEELGGTGETYDVQILCPTKAGVGGTKNLNLHLHNRYRTGADPVYCYDVFGGHGVVQAATMDRTLLKVGDLVIYTANDYELDLRNGSLGKIVQALPVRDEDSECCIVDFEGRSLALKTKQLHQLCHAYGITIHKSQGSQFQRVIVPIRRSRLLDQALLYTAVTRGIEQVILVGDEAAARAAILAPAAATRRHVGLPKLIR